MLTDTVVWELDLFIAGETPKSQTVYNNLKQILQTTKVPCRINVSDLSQQPQLAKENQIISTPTTIRRKPVPKITLIGDLSNNAKVISTLNLKIN